MMMVNDLEFRVDENQLMKPQEIFFSMAKKYFHEQDYEKSLALADAYRTLEPDDKDMLNIVNEIIHKGIISVSREKWNSVYEELKIFNSIPIDTKEKLISPKNYICIHPFEEKRKDKAKTWAKGEDIKTIVVGKDNKSWDECERLEYQVFVDENYIKPNKDKRISSFDEYQKMDFIAAVADDKIIGIMRIIKSGDAIMRKGLFPTIDASEKLNIYKDQYEMLMQMDPRKITDIATMAIKKDYRDSKASKSMITRGMIRMWKSPPIRFSISCIDTPFYRKLKERGLPYEDLGPSTFYWGSPTTACMIDI